MKGRHLRSKETYNRGGNKSEELKCANEFSPPGDVDKGKTEGDFKREDSVDSSDSGICGDSYWSPCSSTSSSPPPTLTTDDIQMTPNDTPGRPVRTPHTRVSFHQEGGGLKEHPPESDPLKTSRKRPLDVKQPPQCVRGIALGRKSLRGSSHNGSPASLPSTIGLLHPKHRLVNGELKNMNGVTNGAHDSYKHLGKEGACDPKGCLKGTNGRLPELRSRLLESDIPLISNGVSGSRLGHDSRQNGGDLRQSPRHNGHININNNSKGSLYNNNNLFNLLNGRKSVENTRTLRQSNPYLTSNSTSNNTPSQRYSSIVDSRGVPLPTSTTPPISKKLPPPDTSPGTKISPLKQAKVLRFPAAPTKKDLPEVCKWRDCNRVMKQGASLLEHIQADHVEGQLSCESFRCLWVGCKVYEKSSCSVSWLERHVLTHGGHKPFKCIVDGCGQRFTSQSALERHVNQHFNNSTPCHSTPNASNSSNGSSQTSSSVALGAASGCVGVSRPLHLNSPTKVFRKHGRKLKIRKRPGLDPTSGSGIRSRFRLFDYFDVSSMERLRWELLCASSMVNRTLPNTPRGDTVEERPSQSEEESTPKGRSTRTRSSSSLTSPVGSKPLNGVVSPINGVVNNKGAKSPVNGVVQSNGTNGEHKEDNSAASFLQDCVTLTPSVVCTRRRTDGCREDYVTWTPTDVIDDGWVAADSTTSPVSIPVCELSVRGQLTVKSLCQPTRQLSGSNQRKRKQHSYR